MAATRRELLTSAAALLIDHWTGWRRGLNASEPGKGAGRKIILVACGGIRREDSIAESGFKNIPHLYGDLLPQSVFYSSIRNSGVTSHYNTTASILSGNWQRVDDWGKTPPESPTLFEYLRKEMRLTHDQTWLISSNKALTNRIGASSARDFGPAFGANVIFPKQLLINAVVRAATQGRPIHSADRTSVRPEIEAILNRDNYDGLGWTVSNNSSSLDTPTLGVLQSAIDELIRTSDPVTGDEFTFLVASQVMRRFEPSMLAISFSDMEVAHFGSYSLHLAGIETVDRLIYELWSEIEKLPAYHGKTTLFVLPEFGRDLDGSTTNGFFNHRQNTDSTRVTWMMCLGDAVRRAQIIEDPIEQTDISPTIARLFDLKKIDLPGRLLPGLWI
jgi:hypothetical protein